MQEKGAFAKIMFLEAKFALLEGLFETGDVDKEELAPFLHLLCSIGLGLTTYRRT